MGTFALTALREILTRLKVRLLIAATRPPLKQIRFLN